MRGLIVVCVAFVVGLVTTVGMSITTEPPNPSQGAAVDGSWDTTSSDSAQPLPVGEFPITTDPADQAAPAIWGDIVVWLDGRNGEWDIYGYNLSTKTEFAITNGPIYRESPAIWGDVVVWAERGDGDPDTDVYGYNLSAQTKFAITIDTATQVTPAIWGDTVVWKDHRSGNWDIYGYDLSTQTEFPIVTNLADQERPAIWADVVVWMDDRNGNWDIYGYDLTTREEFAITSDQVNQTAPAIWEDIVVWEDRRNSESYSDGCFWTSTGNIYGYNLSTHAEFPVIADHPNPSSPSIWANIVTWGQIDRIYGFDLLSGEDFYITADSIRLCHYSQETLAMWDDIVVWVDERNGNRDIYGLRFGAALEIAPQILSFNPQWEGEPLTNKRVKITQPLAGRSPLDWGVRSVTGWLDIGSMTGTTPSDVSVSVNDSDLPAGFYKGRVVIEGTNPSALGSPQTVDAYYSVVKDGWTTFTDLWSTRALAVAGDYLWVGGSGGVIRWDTRDGTYTKFTTADGLGRIEVSDIATDQASTIWVGHRDGLDQVGASRFDGSTWTIYSTENSGLISNEVNTIAADKNNGIWFGTETGVSKLSISDGEETWTTYTVENSGLAGNDVRAIAFASDGDVWFGTGSAGVSVFDGSDWITYNTENSGLVYDAIQAIAVDSEGTAWIGTAGGCYPRIGCWGGLSELDGTTWTTHLEYEDISTISIDSTGKIWTLAGGVKVFDGATWTTYDKSGAALVIDNNDKVWLAKPEQFSVFDGTTWTDYCIASCSPHSSFPGPPTDNGGGVGAMTTANDGRLWIEAGNTLSIYDGNTWDYIGRLSGDVRAMVTDKKGKIWIGNGERLEVFDGSHWTQYTSDNSGLPDNWGVKDIAVDHDNNIWLHLGESGITRFDGTTWTTFTELASGYEPYGSLTVDPQGKVWAGHREGISVFDGSNWTTYRCDEFGFPCSFVVDIAADHEGKIWFSVGDQGVTVFDGTNWTTYTTENSGLAGDYYVIEIAVDRQGRVWFAPGKVNGGRVGTGVSMFDGETWTIYDTSNSGLASNGVSAIAFDCVGNVWFGTSGGVSRFGTRALLDPFGNFNCDCRVDVADIMKVAGRFGTNWDDPTYTAIYDIDYDGDTDVADIMGVAAAWGNTCSLNNEGE